MIKILIFIFIIILIMISAKAGEETASFAYEQALLQGSLAYSIEYYY